MGSAMAANLMKAGHDVTVFNLSPEKRRALLELGAHEAGSVADACHGEVLITMLADDTAVADVALAKYGIVENLAKGAIHLSMSTISVALSKHLSETHARAGQRFVAAPVFGRSDAAAAAKLFIVAGGEAAAVETCKPLFDALGQKTVPISTEPAAANLVKLSGNFLSAAAGGGGCRRRVRVHAQRVSTLGSTALSRFAASAAPAFGGDTINARGITRSAGKEHFI